LSIEALLEFEAKMKPYQAFVYSASLGLDMAKDNMKRHLLRARTTNLEVMCARVVVEPKLEASKKTELLTEQTAAFARDLHMWGIQHPVLATSAWKPLWAIVQGFLPQTST
jgi:hypothetical protein